MQGNALQRWVVAAAAAALAIAMLALPDARAASDAHERLQQEPELILARVAQQMAIELRADVPPPRVYLESQTPLAQFQDAVQAQWGHRPARFANVYVVARNEIYLSDDPAYYRRMRRTLDESLAHEYAHFVQVHYFGADLSDESCEAQALDVQWAFRRDLAAG